MQWRGHGQQLHLSLWQAIFAAQQLTVFGYTQGVVVCLFGAMLFNDAHGEEGLLEGALYLFGHHLQRQVFLLNNLLPVYRLPGEQIDLPGYMLKLQTFKLVGIDGGMGLIGLFRFFDQAV